MFGEQLFDEPGDPAAGVIRVGVRDEEVVFVGVSRHIFSSARIACGKQRIWAEQALPARWMNCRTASATSCRRIERLLATAIREAVADTGGSEMKRSTLQQSVGPASPSQLCPRRDRSGGASPPRSSAGRPVGASIVHSTPGPHHGRPICAFLLATDGRRGIGKPQTARPVPNASGGLLGLFQRHVEDGDSQSRQGRDEDRRDQQRRTATANDHDAATGGTR